MLTLQRKQEESILIGEDELKLLSFTGKDATVTFRGLTHTIPRGRMWKLSNTLTVCYSQKKGSCIRIQLDTPLPILRKEVAMRDKTIEP